MAVIDQLFKLHYVTRALLLDWASGKHLRILFSESAWEAEIRRMFKFTWHQVMFGSIQTLEDENYDLVVPLNIEDTLFLAHNSKFSRNRFPVPERAIVELLDDKLAFNDYLKNQGFEELIPPLGVATPPYILKKRIGSFGRECHYVDTAVRHECFRAELSSPDYFTQAVIPGQREYATHILCKNGEILNHLCIEYRFAHEIPIKGKDPAYRIRLAREQHLDEWRRILGKIAYNGLCCVNYKLKDGAPQLLEINPRFGGSLALFFFAFIKYLA